MLAQRLDGWGNTETYVVYWQPISKPKKITVGDTVYLDKGTSKVTVSNGKELMEAISGICKQVLKENPKMKFVLKCGDEYGSCLLKDKSFEEKDLGTYSYGIITFKKKDGIACKPVRFKHTMKNKTYKVSQANNIVLREEDILPHKKENKIEVIIDHGIGNMKYVYSRYTIPCAAKYRNLLIKNARETFKIKDKLYKEKKLQKKSSNVLTLFKNFLNI